MTTSMRGGFRQYGEVDAELRALAVAATQGLIAQGRTRTAAARALAPTFGVHWNTICNWLRAAEEQEMPTTVAALQARVRELTDELAQARAVIRKLTAAGGQASLQECPDIGRAG
ncbi:hypothetical protein [Nocardia veterana]|uniref:Transposase n=1 Tax=Nocardia veterana TaxID=132249 RepID=A0A7X6RKQ7_9NOCA|nr:hypothetical protein [Nocardia veterana]NKY88894.1 hypothetical protein [Nocardia veterana]